MTSNNPIDSTEPPYAQGIEAGHINCTINCTGQCERWGLKIFDPSLTEEIENPFVKGTTEYKKWEDGYSDGYSDCSAYFDGDYDED